MALPAIPMLIGLLGKVLMAITAIKFFFVFLIAIILPTVLNNLMFKFIEQSLTLVGSNLPTNTQSLAFGLSGVAGYLGTQLGLVDLFSITMTFITAKIALSMIPFSPIK